MKDESQMTPGADPSPALPGSSFIPHPSSFPLVLVTGASQGIGEKIAETFAREAHARLALVARNHDGLQRVADRCRELGAPAAEPFPCDVADAAAVDAMAAAVRARFPDQPVDVLVNNAGQFVPDALLTMPVATFDDTLAANLRSVFLVTRAFAPAMAARGSGDVFIMASVAGLRAFPAGGAYVAAKHGVLGLARAFREELKPSGVRVCAVLPGATVSPSWDGAGVPPDRMMPTEDVARTFLDVYRLSRRTVVEEIVLRPQLGDV